MKFLALCILFVSVAYAKPLGGDSDSASSVRGLPGKTDPGVIIIPKDSIENPERESEEREAKPLGDSDSSVHGPPENIRPEVKPDSIEIPDRGSEEREGGSPGLERPIDHTEYHYDDHHYGHGDHHYGMHLWHSYDSWDQELWHVIREMVSDFYHHHVYTPSEQDWAFIEDMFRHLFEGYHHYVDYYYDGVTDWSDVTGYADYYNDGVTDWSDVTGYADYYNDGVTGGSDVTDYADYYNGGVTDWSGVTGYGGHYEDYYGYNHYGDVTGSAGGPMERELWKVVRNMALDFYMHNHWAPSPADWHFIFEHMVHHVIGGYPQHDDSYHYDDAVTDWSDSRSRGSSTPPHSRGTTTEDARPVPVTARAPGGHRTEGRE